MDLFRFVERVVTTLLRLVLWFARAVWGLCAGIAELIVPKAIPGLRFIVAAIIFVGVLVMFRELLDATGSPR